MVVFTSFCEIFSLTISPLSSSVRNALKTVGRDMLFASSILRDDNNVCPLVSLIPQDQQGFAVADSSKSINTALTNTLS